MGLCLVAAIDWHFWLVVIPEVVVALGAVIFVHELGHFLVAKACGVKCEKFYLGFDVYGLKLLKFQWGETEYGIGAIPLGGYVKMLGQEDNPARAQEELERARLSGDSARENGEPQYDPRSYMAQSVSKRMAIISAGVIMNVIFAFVASLFAYRLGVLTIPCVVSHVTPGRPAWKADLRPGDEIVEVAGVRNPRFDDLKSEISLDTLSHGVPVTVRRPGHDQPVPLTVFPEKIDKAPEIGVLPPFENRLNLQQAAWEASAAAHAQPPLEPGDWIVGVNGEAVADYTQLLAALARYGDQPLVLDVLRPKSAAGEDPTGPPADAEPLEVTIPPRPMRTLGLWMSMGRIAAVQPNSPAAAAGLEEGDFIVRVGDVSPVDPLRLPDLLRKLAGQTVTIAVSREGHQQPLAFSATLRESPWYEPGYFEGFPVAFLESLPMTSSVLGIAYRVVNRVHDTYPGTPAAEAKLRPGDEIIKAEFVPAGPEQAKLERKRGPLEIVSNESQPNIPYLMLRLQRALPDTKVKLTLGDGRNVELGAVDAPDWYDPDRGLIYNLRTEVRRAATWGEAARFARMKTWSSLTLVYRSILALVENRVSAKMLVGPVGIAEAAGAAASEGLAELLLFLSLISANLAVVNFLPIPLLDGGHMVFLVWEAVRGKPASERVILAFHYAGFCLILSLMAWVLFLDAQRTIGNFG